MLQFIASFVNELNIGAGARDTRVGVVIFSDRAQVVVRLGEITDTALLQDRITNLAYVGSNTNTQAGLRVVNEQLFTPAGGDRPGVPNLVIVLTDGKSTVNPELTVPNAVALRNRNIRIIAIGITSSIDEAELKGISSEPQSLGSDYFTSPNFQGLTAIIQMVVRSACEVTPEPTSEFSCFPTN